MKHTAKAAAVACLVLSGVALVGAQRRGGGPAQPLTGTVQRVTIHGRALEGNLEGDSADRAATVYLPPSYARDEARRFPVVYLLHGYGGREDTFTDRLGALQNSADALASQPGFSELIVVTPSAFTLHKGSMYSASPTTGDWERFVAEDLVAYMDSHYRTLATRVSRGLAGHSMGGYGAIRIGLKRPDVFMSLYAMSACCLAANREPNPSGVAAAAAIVTRAQAEEAAKAPGFGPSVTLASAAAWSPNPLRPPLFLDLPVEAGVVRPEVVAKWVANAPIEMVKEAGASLNRYYAIAMDVGTGDPLLPSNRALHQELQRQRIAHYYEEYEGDHTNRIRERLGRNLLPFFAKNLVAPLNPTSPVSPPR